MALSLDQARALDAFARHGTFEAAGRALAKRHTAVVYALGALEESLGLALLDRSGYRSTLTPAGEEILVEARALLAAAHAVEARAEALRTGWEPRLRVVVDGIVPVDRLLGAVRELSSLGATTRISVTTAFLSGVEEELVADHADLMLSVLPVREPGLVRVALEPVDAVLVAHKSHPLARARGPLGDDDLAAHVWLTVRGSDPRLQLRTSELDASAVVALSDFHAKKAAILSGFGVGWLPEWLAKPELASKELVRIHWRGGSEHSFRVTLAHRGRGRLGRAGALVTERLKAGRKRGRG